MVAKQDNEVSVIGGGADLTADWKMQFKLQGVTSCSNRASPSQLPLYRDHAVLNQNLVALAPHEFGEADQEDPMAIWVFSGTSVGRRGIEASREVLAVEQEGPHGCFLGLKLWDQQGQETSYCMSE